MDLEFRGHHVWYTYPISVITSANNFLILPLQQNLKGDLSGSWWTKSPGMEILSEYSRFLVERFPNTINHQLRGQFCKNLFMALALTISLIQGWYMTRNQTVNCKPRDCDMISLLPVVEETEHVHSHGTKFETLSFRVTVRLHHAFGSSSCATCDSTRAFVNRKIVDQRENKTILISSNMSYHSW